MTAAMAMPGNTASRLTATLRLLAAQDGPAALQPGSAQRQAMAAGRQCAFGGSSLPVDAPARTRSPGGCGGSSTGG